MDAYLKNIYQGDESRFLDALQAAQDAGCADDGEAFDPRHDMRAHQDTLELVWEQTQARIEAAYQRDIDSFDRMFEVRPFYVGGGQWDTYTAFVGGVV